MKISLGVTGGISAYKAVSLLRLLKEAGHSVRVIPTPSALRFVGEPTWAALSGQTVSTDVWDDVNDVPHISLGAHTDLLLIAPATANTLAKAATGIADDLLTNTLLSVTCPVIFAPAMHTQMWEHAATQQSVDTLRSRGAWVLPPEVGRLTGEDSGPGRLPEPEELYLIAEQLLQHPNLRRDMTGQRVVVTAGPTQENIDPVRFLTNHSSGKQGYALARAAALRGAHVTLITGPTALADPLDVQVVRVHTTREMHTIVMQHATGADAVVMAAAPADFTPEHHSAHKVKKTEHVDGMSLSLRETPDILSSVVAARDAGEIPHATRVIGFAAETGDDTRSVEEYARDKLARKRCDMLVANRVGAGRGFGMDDNAATLLTERGVLAHIPDGPKSVLAHAVWDAAGELPTQR